MRSQDRERGQRTEYRDYTENGIYLAGLRLRTFDLFFEADVLVYATFSRLLLVCAVLSPPFYCSGAESHRDSTVCPDCLLIKRTIYKYYITKPFIITFLAVLIRSRISCMFLIYIVFDFIVFFPHSLVNTLLNGEYEYGR